MNNDKLGNELKDGTLEIEEIQDWHQVERPQLITYEYVRGNTNAPKCVPELIFGLIHECFWSKKLLESKRSYNSIIPNMGSGGGSGLPPPSLHFCNPSPFL